MPRYLSLTCLAAVLITTLTGCSTPTTPTTSVSANIDYSQRRYEDTRFDKPGISLPAQTISFKTDIDGCEMLAQKRYEEALANSAKLGKIYGQSVTPQTLQSMKRMQVLSCMTGKEANAENGKGWMIVK
ncbi:hypothetical protein PMI36_05406 [Pseudomonas sp. GM79]|uniref:hypothetical protein n=1 Tax=Pseudomonas sp. GM79 TaxID=1144338 RepID=UPI00026F59AD|nr:hypothetical protein [Pseudomonas sp. GM79]EJN17680.1 hypothetical protein PMI36_05406 [Pseudomonas sp. GM79]